VADLAHGLSLPEYSGATPIALTHCAIFFRGGHGVISAVPPASGFAFNGMQTIYEIGSIGRR
jgi:hypothetical protein